MNHPIIMIKPYYRPVVWIFFLMFAAAEVIIVRQVATLNVLDARLFYSPCQAVSLIKSLDQSTMSAYRIFNRVDFIIIALYSILLVLWFRLLDPDVDLNLRGWPWLGLLPGIFDLVENIGVALLLNSSQPEQNPEVWLAVLGTPLKWLGALLALSLLIFAEIRGLRRRLLQGRPWYDLSGDQQTPLL